MEKILLIVVGIIDLYFTGRVIVDTNFAKRYVLESPKAYIWRKMFGEYTALTITRYLFAPVGAVLGLLLIAFGLMK